MYLSKSPRMLQWLLRRAMLGGIEPRNAIAEWVFHSGGGVIMNIESCRGNSSSSLNVSELHRGGRKPQHHQTALSKHMLALEKNSE